MALLAVLPLQLPEAPVQPRAQGLLQWDRFCPRLRAQATSRRAGQQPLQHLLFLEELGAGGCWSLLEPTGGQLLHAQPLLSQLRGLGGGGAAQGQVAASGVVGAASRVAAPTASGLWQYYKSTNGVSCSQTLSSSSPAPGAVGPAPLLLLQLVLRLLPLILLLLLLLLDPALWLGLSTEGSVLRLLLPFLLGACRALSCLEAT